MNRIEQLQPSAFTGKGLKLVQSLFQLASGDCKGLVVIIDRNATDRVEDAAMA